MHVVASLDDSSNYVYFKQTSLFYQAERWRQMWQRPGAQRGPGRGPRLADPPAIKELVRGEVQMLLRTLGERSSAGGRYVETCTRPRAFSEESGGWRCARGCGASVWGTLMQRNAAAASFLQEVTPADRSHHPSAPASQQAAAQACQEGVSWEEISVR